MASFALQVPRALHTLEQNAGPFDIIHSHTYADTFLSKSALRGLRVLGVHHLATSTANSMGVGMVARLTHLSSEYGPAVVLEGLALRRADHLVADSHFTKNDISRKYPRIDRARVTVIYPGAIPLGLEANSESMTRLREKWGLTNDRHILLYVGRLEERKGTSLLLDAFSRIEAKTNAKLVLIGSANGPRYENLARNLGIAGKVIFAGFVDDVTLRTAYGIASVLVHPASLEGFGITVADAIASGIPVAATRVGSIPELVRDGIDGHLAEYGNPIALADAIEKALGMRAVATSRERGVGSRRFTWDRSARATLSLYERLLSNHD